jgi:predicted MFS family arabinose efflux permease
MSAAMVMRLVPAASVPRGLAIIYGGNAIATAVAAPLGSLMGGLIGWRGAFFSVVPLAAVALVWQAVTLPQMPAESRSDAGMPGLLRDRRVAMGMLAVALSFMGQFALFTYLRPFLEQVTGVGVSSLSALLLVVGLAGVVGTSAVGRFMEGRMHATLAAIPAVMAVVAVAVAVFGASTWATAALLALWGTLSAATPVAWSTWLTRTLPDDAEAGGGLMVAIIQLGITVGATAGGVVFDAAGPVATFLSAAAILALAAAAALSARLVHARLRYA